MISRKTINNGCEPWNHACPTKQATTHKNIRHMLECTRLSFLAKNEPITFCGAKMSWMWMHACHFGAFEYTCLFVAYCDLTATNPTKSLLSVALVD